MCRLLLICCLIHAPLFAVGVGDKSPLALADLRVTLDLSMTTATVTSKATLHNPGEDPFTSRLTLPRDLVPDDQRKAYTLKIAGIAQAPTGDEGLNWNVDFEPDQQLEVAWTYTVNPIDLPHAHLLGMREVRVLLSHMHGYISLPDQVHFTITSVDMPPELFGSREGDTESIDMKVDAHVDDFTYRWFATTWTGKRDALLRVRDEFEEPQRTHRNRSYTETLVQLADLYAMQDDYDSLADVCATLATLEEAGGKVITHCGPWAKWRKHVPWQLIRMHALKQAGKDTKLAAQAAKKPMAALWAAYLKAHLHQQPFEHFDRNRHGNYWDYDWERTRELYAAALEVLGEADAAQAVRETE